MSLLDILHEAVGNSNSIVCEYRHCGEKLSEDADECPHCGAEEIVQYTFNRTVEVFIIYLKIDFHISPPKLPLPHIGRLKEEYIGKVVIGQREPLIGKQNLLPYSVCHTVPCLLVTSGRTIW